MSIEQQTEVDKTVTIAQLLEELYRFIEELEQQVRNNAYPLIPVSRLDATEGDPPNRA